MQNKIDYLIKDNLCKKTIEKYDDHSSLHDWLAQYSDLYNSLGNNLIQKNNNNIDIQI